VRFIISTFLLGLLLISCGVSTTVLMKEYEGQKLTGKQIAIVRLFEQPMISNKDDVIDDLGPGIPEEVYSSFFNEKFVNVFKNSNRFSNVYYIDNLSKSELEELTLNINNEEQMKFFLPSVDSKISIESEFILFIDNLQVSRIAAQSGNWIGGNYSGGSFGKLYHQMYFAIWDNSQGKVVSYGRVEEDTSVIFALTRDNWFSVIRGLCNKILASSPFVSSYQNTR
jgi:hypothetical protein